METDIRCKVLARLRPNDLLTLIGDPHANVLSTDTVELPDMRRTVDFVYKLESAGQLYYRHLEFQAEPDPEMNQRCLIYNIRLIAHYGLPVITTIIYLFRHRQVEEPVYRVLLGDEEINRWRFESVEMWEVEASEAIERGLPGLAALVPLMKGGTLKRVEEAARLIEERAPVGQRADLLAILHAFGENKYTLEQLERIIGRDRLMESTIYREGVAEGLAEGLAEGQLMTARELCLEVVRKWHPRAGQRVWTAIENCTDLEALKDVNLNASEWSTRQILRRLGQA